MADDKYDVVINNLGNITSQVRYHGGTEDDKQDVILALLGNVLRYDPSRARYNTFSSKRIKGVVRNNQRKTRNHMETFQDVYDEECVEDSNRYTTKMLEDSETIESLSAAILDLPRQWRLVIINHFYLYRSIKDIAADMDLTRQRVFQIRNSALKKLKLALSK